METNFSEFMTTEEICAGWDELYGYIDTLKEAINNRLQSDELNFDEDTYEDGDNEECDTLLRMREILDNIDY